MYGRKERRRKMIDRVCWRATCWECDKELDVYCNDEGNDGSTAIYCKDCYDKKDDKK